MTKNSAKALHKVNTAVNDVLQGYDTMIERAEPEIAPILTDLSAMHRRHGTALQAQLAALGHDGDDDTSLRGAMNAVAVTMRDWLGSLDKGSLDAVERGENALRDIYDDAMTDWDAAEDPAAAALLQQQYDEIGEQINRLERV